jgi:cell wall-associated NlpC family hydrolase
MKRILAALLIAVCVCAPASAQTITDFFSGIKTAIEKNLGRPYVWGATGLKSYDCSGFVWRVMYDNGILMKRTTARKFYMILKPVPKEEEGQFGTLVFFDDLKHMGIMDSPKAFYHAQVSAGTNRSELNSFWKKKIYGYRKMPTPEKVLSYE